MSEKKKRCRQEDDIDDEPSDAESLGNLSRPFLMYNHGLTRSSPIRKPRYRRGLRRYFRRRTRATVGRVRGNASVPDRMFIKFRYQDNYTATGTTASTQTWVWRGNSLHDPYQGAGGAQPYQFDQWKQFYHRYRVYGCKIVVKVWCTPNPGLNLIQGNTLYVIPVTDNSVFDAYSLPELPRCRQRVLMPQYAGRPTVIKSYASTAQIWGLSKNTVRTNAEFTAPQSADPASQWYWISRIQGQNPTTAVSDGTVTYNWQVRLVYYACLYDRVWLTRS